jgi:lipoprotein Spr
MQVLKIIGLTALLFTSATLLTFAQNQEKCEQEVKKTVVKKDPIDFVQNCLLNSKTQQNQLEKKFVPAGQNNLPATPKVVKKPVVVKEGNFGTQMLSWVQQKYSSMLEVMPDQISNVMLYRFIDEWYGVRYRMGGTTKSGVDCSAFVQHLYQYVFGLNILRTACLQFQSSQYIKNPADLKEGDLVFFRINTSRISHVGVYLKNNFFVHSASSKGVSIANLTQTYWARYFAGGGRIVE